MKKRILAGILAALMAAEAAVFPLENASVYASSIESVQSAENIETAENIEDTEGINTTDSTEATESMESTESTEDAENTEVTEETEELEEETGEKAETKTEEIEETEELEKENEEETEEKETAYFIQYLVMDSEVISLNETQKVVLGIASEKEIEYASLQYHNLNSGESFSQNSSGVTDGGILFEIVFRNEGQVGAYQLDTVTYVIDGKSYTEDLVAAGIKAVFGMEQEVESNPDAIIEEAGSNDMSPDESVDIDIVQTDENGNVTSETTYETAIDNATAGTPAMMSSNARWSTQGIVVTLDPGHDSTHAGAQWNGLKEEEINLKIAAYCKEELEKYQGVVVYLSRSTDGSCPYPGTTSGDCNTNRVSTAAGVGTDIFVSLHNNSSTSTSAHGAMVFYPNSNYNANVGQSGKNLAQIIENHLVALGLYNRGITIKDAQQDKYPDGTTADYYGVIRNCKLQGIPAIIVEHAFMSNSSDVSNFLSTDEQLKQLGIADATAIAEYYGLSKGIQVTSGGVQVSNLNNAAGTASISVSSVSPDDKISSVSFAVWSKADQSDLYWYSASKVASGSYSATMDLVKHLFNQGTYNIDAYAQDIYGNSHFLGRTNGMFGVIGGEVSVMPLSAGKYKLTLAGVTVPGGMAGATFEIWGDANGRNDLKSYEATLNSDGTWSAVLPVSQHGETGVYHVWAYVKNAAGGLTCAVKTAFEHAETASIENIEIRNMDSDAGTFDIFINGVSATCGVDSVQVPVWSQADQSDIVWYTASKQSDGSYATQVNLKNHNYNYAEYTVHVYVTSDTQVKACVGATSVTVNAPQAKLKAVLDAEEKVASLSASKVGLPGGVKNVYFAVWSDNGGQDDLVWYEAVQSASGKWTRDISIANHKTSGIYQVHLYGEDTNGNRVFLGNTTFNISEVSVGSIKVKNQNAANGTFDVFISGITSPSGVDKMQIPVWSQADRSDMYWYTAAKQGDGSYAIQVNVKNHNYNYGNYTIHTYVTAGNGINQFTGSASNAIYPPSATVSVGLSADETIARLTASNVKMAGGVQKVSFAVWSDKGGQDDLVWYQATQAANGTWSSDIAIATHKTEGRYQVHVYGQDISGKSIVLATTTFYVSDVKIASVEVKNLNSGTGTFDVFVSGIISPSGVSRIQIPVWSQADQSDLYWYTAWKQGDGTYATQVNLKNHNYNYGNYTIHTYVTAVNGIDHYTGSASVVVNQPQAKMCATLSDDAMFYNLLAYDVGLTGGVQGVRFAVWSEEDGQDDIHWYDATNTANGVWQQNFLLSNHRTAGVYEADTYAIDGNGIYVPLASCKFTVTGPSASAVDLVNYNEADGTFGVQVLGAASPAGISLVRVAVWSSGNQTDLVWYDATPNNDGSYTIGADIRNHSNNTGLYYADAYVYDNNGIAICAGRVTCSIVNVTNILHPISGSTSVTVEQMAAYYNRNAIYPTFYENTEAPTIEAFCQIYIEECRAEGIKAEMAFCQAMKETGFLRYGGNVKIEQYNFAGIGSTGAGVAGEAYSDVRTGVRAQIQHLKAYANSDSLNNACVDTRFRYVTRGTAPYVEWLGIQENPYGKGWATATNYGYQIVSMVNNLKQY